jgi:carbamoyltransferase
MSSERLDLYVSLGHNSSAVLARDGVVVRGFEQERIDRKKSSSAYPRDAIEEAMGSLKDVDTVYVSHWFDHFELSTNKYVDVDDLARISSQIVGLTPDRTHHDAHAASAIGFARDNGVSGNMRVLVIDGFGNNQECLSAYDYKPGSRVPRALRHRTYGYHLSLGLMYQYVTEFLKLKPNQDEYKLLGYEAHVLDYISLFEAADIVKDIGNQADEHAVEMMTSVRFLGQSSSLINYDDLKWAKTYWTDVATKWRERFKPNMDLTGERTCVAFCAQTFLELCVKAIVNLLPRAPDDATIVMTGGSFYNVKLSRFVAKTTGMRCFTHPLAGDQGAAMGAGLITPRLTDLCIGTRYFSGAISVDGVIVATRDTWAMIAAEHIYAGKVVNVVRGDMEYGPRALCHTTSFALPTKHMVRAINALNERDEAMPMAPVMTRESAETLLDSTELAAIRGNDRFMITTVAFRHEPNDGLMGVAHKDPLSNLWTARPQVTDDPEIVALLEGSPHGCLINTSFNYHGEPIVNTIDDAMRTHAMQRFRAVTCGLDAPVTIVVMP